MNQLRQVILIVVIAALFSCNSKTAMATDSPFISEVYPAPNADEREWIELMNPLEEVATISGWFVYDQVSSPSLLLTITVLELASHQAMAFDLPSAKLNNSGDSVVLFNQEGLEIDRFTYDSSVVGKSWQKYTQLTDQFLATPTKSSASLPPVPTIAPIPTPTPTAMIDPSPTSVMVADQGLNAIKISKVVACPNADERERIELYNTGETTISIENWYISDAQGNQRLLHGVILPNSDLIVDWDGAILNNQGDAISLFSSTDQLSLTLQIPPCIIGTSYSPGQSSSDPLSTNTITLPPTQPSAFVTISTSHDYQNNLGANNNKMSSNSFIPPMPSIILETPQQISFEISPPIQLYSTSAIEIPAFMGAIISFSSLLLAYYFTDVSH